MCGFKPGDEVVCVRAGATGIGTWCGTIVTGGTYEIESVGLCPSPHPDAGIVVVWLRGETNVCPLAGLDVGFRPDRFRKVQRLDLTAWLSTAQTFEEPKRAPAKKRERSQ